MKKSIIYLSTLVVLVLVLAGCFKDNASAPCVGNTFSQDKLIIDGYLTANNLSGQYSFNEEYKAYSSVLEPGTGNSFVDADMLSIKQDLAILGGTSDVQSVTQSVEFSKLAPFFKFYFTMLKPGGKISIIVPSSQSMYGCNGGFDSQTGAQIIPANAQLKYTYTVSKVGAAN